VLYCGVPGQRTGPKTAKPPCTAARIGNLRIAAIAD
jgi:hypothetical protein